MEVLIIGVNARSFNSVIISAASASSGSNILVIIRSLKPYVNYTFNGNEKYVNSDWILPKESSTVVIIK